MGMSGKTRGCLPFEMEVVRGILQLLLRQCLKSSNGDDVAGVCRQACLYYLIPS